MKELKALVAKMGMKEANFKIEQLKQIFIMGQILFHSNLVQIRDMILKF